MNFPRYVSSDYDKALMASCPICSALLDWHGELVAKRKEFICDSQFDLAIRMWRWIDPVWRALKASYIRAGGLVADAEMVAA